MLPKGKVVTHSSEETFETGVRFAQSLNGNELVAFFGDLGSGKTTFVKGMIHALTGCSPDEITSPTFTYLQVYDRVFHFDLYRLPSGDHFQEFSEYLEQDGICLIEWAEKIELPKRAIRVSLEYPGEYQDENSRLITIV
jgi:tRNA threonylcarbamoyladenosine biosynthesis protein TsaE